jgi:hypothetical protein
VNEANGKSKLKILGRKFLMGIVFAVLVILNRKMSLGLTPEDLYAIAGVFGIVVIGESLPDAAHAWKGQATALETAKKPGP